MTTRCEVDPAPLTSVIARLDRATQYRRVLVFNPQHSDTSALRYWITRMRG